MIVYHSSKQGFVEDVFNGTITDDIDNAFYIHLGRHTSPNEVLSWKNSMMHMYKVVNTPEIPDNSSIAIEYQIPLTSKRIDFIISGSDADGKSHIVIIELKQWEHAQLSENPIWLLPDSSTAKLRPHIRPIKPGHMHSCLRITMRP